MACAHGLRRMAGLMLLLAALSGCDRAASSVTAEEDTPGYPKTVVTALGTATIAEAPRRIVALGAGAEDVVLDLGIVPIAIESHRWGGDAQGYLPWFKQAVLARGAALPVVVEMYPELEIERIINLKPDLIIATQSGLTQELYDRLSWFAPVIAYPHQPWLTTPQQQIDLIARALDRQPQAQQLKAQLHQLMQTTGRTLPGIGNTTFAYIKGGTGGNQSLSVYVKEDPRVDTLVQLGLTLLPAVSELKAPFGGFSASIGMENADLLNQADVLVSWFNSEKERRELEAQPLFRTIPAVKNGGYIPLTDQSLVVAMSYGTPLSVRWGLTQFMPLLREAMPHHEPQ